MADLSTEGPKYYFHVCCPVVLDEPWTIAFVPKTFWHKEQCMDDQGAPATLLRLLRAEGMSEMMEWIFEIEGGEPEALEKEAMLLAHGFEKNTEFSKMMDELAADEMAANAP
jgi:hypothetical protein